MSTTPSSARIVWIAAIVLALLHQDFWLWDNKNLLFGFLPVGLAYHALYSILAACLWAAAVKWAWPSNIEAWAEEEDSNESSNSTQQG